MRRNDGREMIRNDGSTGFAHKCSIRNDGRDAGREALRDLGFAQIAFTTIRSVEFCEHCLYCPLRVRCYLEYIYSYRF